MSDYSAQHNRVVWLDIPVKDLERACGFYRAVRDAVAQVAAHGGQVTAPIHAIGPHGHRALILDSEGNRLALHSSVDA